ncbi:MAG: MgtC/SapB family protein [Candidatus Paracaedimonas acanthamoebae]|uniref:Protein MgtC n=1 Tax=Candidatus Paracaedimonas acanthamoebae TaxID=244581 RepID=A0A8J7PXK9_9PROT|nr:MgtC/SapB family protein [Candidatus Paracaedimonas acanthamoebae]
MEIDWQLELHLCIKIIIAFFLGALIGFEREYKGHEAGIRTFGFIALGSCIFSLASFYVGSGDPGRIAAQIVSGVSFMGIGLIFRDQGFIRGLTTAATLWCTAAIGMTIAFDMFIIGILSTIVIVVFLSIPHLKHWKGLKVRKKPADLS